MQCTWYQRGERRVERLIGPYILAYGQTARSLAKFVALPITVPKLRLLIRLLYHCDGQNIKGNGFHWYYHDRSIPFAHPVWARSLNNSLVYQSWNLTCLVVQSPVLSMASKYLNTEDFNLAVSPSWVSFFVLVRILQVYQIVRAIPPGKLITCREWQ